MSSSASNDVQINKLIENLNSRDNSTREAAIKALLRLKKALEDKPLGDTFLQEQAHLRDIIEEISKLKATTPSLSSQWHDSFSDWLLAVEKERKRLASSYAIDFQKLPHKIMLADANSTSDKKEIEISSDFLDLLVNLSQRTNSSESEIIKKGLILVGLAEKVKEEGLGLAVVDNNGSVVANIEDF